MGEHSSPPPLSPERSNMPMLYYGLVVVGTAAVVLAIYNLVIIKRCANLRRQRPNRRFLDTAATSQSFQNSSVILVSSFKYTKEAEGQEQHKRSSDYECAVCLSVFEDDEDVRKLPRCKHSFHAQCIDMWLYSHFDCPLCRAPVEPGVLPHQHRDSFEISRQGFLESGIPV